jgi:DNA-binding FadR family transcriptional regulator
MLTQRPELTAADDAEITGAHLAIHDAIARRDGDGARAAMHTHILDVERRLEAGAAARTAS